ncbi:MAG: hypothetical protein AAB649_00825, partial [Patescibacteria group bacterium]
MAIASISSSRRFFFGSRMSLGIIWATAFLSAPPCPVTASFICCGEHSITGRLAMPAAASAGNATGVFWVKVPSRMFRYQFFQ